MLLCLSSLLLAATAAFVQDDARAVSPSIGDEVAGIVRFDLDRLDIDGLFKKLDIPAGLREQAPVVAAKEWTAALKKAGAHQVYLLLDPQEMLETPTIVIPAAAGSDLKAIGAMFLALSGKPGGPRPGMPFAWTAIIEKPGVVIVAGAKSEARIKKAAPANRADLGDALGALKGSVVGIAFALSESQRRTLEETVPQLPQELGGGSITTVTRGMEWTILRVDAEPKFDLNLVSRAMNPAAAKELHTLYELALKLMAEATEKEPTLAPFAKELGKAEAKLVGNELKVNLSLSAAAALVKQPIEAMRDAGMRNQCTNNEKHLALAMHNYHNAYGGFPPAFITSPEGKPLLSWRVSLLPFLDQKALYEEFHLNESWDSPHNKALIAKMPRVFVCPSADAGLAAAGKTTYLTPRAKETIFPGATGVKLSEITDGTSNTIFIVDASDDRAAVWTKPDDWETNEQNPWAGLLGHHRDGVNVCFADGSVHFLKASFHPSVLWATLTKSGGEVINQRD